MAQIFPRWSNRIPLIAVALGALFVVTSVGGVAYFGSPKFTDVGYRPRQPVPFSHALHAGDLGIDCRYCHAAVEVSAVAGLPPTQTCMNCHRLIARDSAKLAVVRESMTSGRPIRWVRVHKVPASAYFNHRVHVRAGVGCVSCHGHIEKMDVVTQSEPLSMSWCLDCHRNPAPNLRPVEEVTNMEWKPRAGAPAPAGPAGSLAKVRPPTACSGCHR